MWVQFRWRRVLVPSGALSVVREAATHACGVRGGRLLSDLVNLMRSQGTLDHVGKGVRVVRMPDVTSIVLVMHVVI